MFDPQKPALPPHRAPTPPVPGAVINGTLLLAPNITEDLVSRGSEIIVDLLTRTDELGESEATHSNSVVYIFR